MKTHYTLQDIDLH